VYLFSPRGHIVGVYHKVRLVPFGEYVPPWGRHPFLQRYPIRSHDFCPGRGHYPLKMGRLHLGPVICFESIFPEISRGLVQHGADVIAVVTSDAWSGHSPELQQHLQASVLRAAETARPVVRAASTGITCLIAPGGRVVEQAPRYASTAVAGTVPLSNLTTPYVRWGDAPVFAFIGLMAAYCLAAWLFRPRPSKSRQARGEGP